MTRLAEYSNLRIERDVMKPTNLLLGLAPWILFTVIAGNVGAGGVGLAALVAFLGSVILAVRGARETGVNIIDAAGVVTFGLLTVVGLAADHHTQQLLVDYGRGGAALVLATVMLVSVATVPFTEQFARPNVDPRYWGSPVFRAVNRRISLLWSGLIYAMAICHMTSGYLSDHGENPRNLLLNWAVPVLVVVVGLKQTERIAEGRITPVKGGAA
jgi:hypothetical protein